MKENANPIVYNVAKSNEKRDEEFYKNLIANEALSRFGFDPRGDGYSGASVFGTSTCASSTSCTSSIPTSVERSVHMAIGAIHERTQEDGVGKPKKSAQYHDPISVLKMSGMFRGDTSVNSSKTIFVGGTTSSSLSSLSIEPPSIFEQCYFLPSQSSPAGPGPASDASGKTKGKLEKDGRRRKRRDPIEAEEVFDIIRNIQDPEHPLTLEQLNVVNLNHVSVKDVSVGTDEDEDKDMDGGDDFSTIDVKFTPTIPHCSMATLIGLCIRVKLLRSLPKRFKITVRINPGTHASELAINRQLNDKERVIAALENVHLLTVVNKCISNGMKGTN
eukprot:CAMPEP_0203670044 /NCGR_PEP_ID=MMETSP0090-20130426/6243_1 /ASSEMBLY_ACC=CAM_ASM_001088 /TAXON_ID=426623 /ORGANISM="Chaetoceros affinis, Strain CCMP159" /LENGTH=330 /DNA_ID=CAMNT_0050534829 /DNA_START=81 /DNA_END=1076 /DNA_ORIENTATION=+